MADRLLVSTHKGLFTFRRLGSDRWEAERPAFLGEDVTLTLLDRRSGRLHAALNLGHFGVKRHISDDGGNTWIEASVPAYDEHDQVITGDGKDPQPAALKLIWALEAGGEDQPADCGPAPHRVDCSAPMTTAKPGRSSAACGIGTNGSTGSAADMTGPPSTPSASIRTTPGRSAWPSRAAERG